MHVCHRVTQSDVLFDIFTTSCCTSCREPDIRSHVTDNNTADRLLVYQNIQVASKLKLNRRPGLWLALKPEAFVLETAGSCFIQQFLCKMVQSDMQQPQVSRHVHAEWPLLPSACKIHWPLLHHDDWGHQALSLHRGRFYLKDLNWAVVISKRKLIALTNYSSEELEKCNFLECSFPGSTNTQISHDCRHSCLSLVWTSLVKLAYCIFVFSCKQTGSCKQVTWTQKQLICYLSPCEVRDFEQKDGDETNPCGGLNISHSLPYLLILRNNGYGTLHLD